MARRAGPLTAVRSGLPPARFGLEPIWPGVAATAVLACAVLVPVGALLARAGTQMPGPSEWAALRFTLLQAVWSTAITVALAIPLARALARRRFPGRGALVLLLGVPFILPVITGTMGLLAVFGRNGWINTALTAMGLPALSPYGLQGILLAHVFFNLPLVTRMLLQGWQAIPAERLRMAESLGLSPWRRFRLVEAPMLAAILPGAALVVFTLCLSSFAVALILGGGPGATTLELAIYQAFRFDFALDRAAVLGVLQLALVGVAGLVALRLVPAVIPDAGRARPVQHWGGGRRRDAAIIALAALFLILPLVAVVLRGAPGLFDLPPPVWRAAARSVTLAALVAGAVVITALAIGMAALRYPALELAGLPGLAVSPLVLGTGLFLLVRPMLSPEALALPATLLANTMAALPFALRLILPRLRQASADHGRLASSLGLSRRIWFGRILWPGLRPAVGLAAGLAAALAMGDLGVIALFADPERATLPLQVMRLMGNYRSNDAAAASLLLVMLSLALFWACERVTRDA